VPIRVIMAVLAPANSRRGRSCPLSHLRRSPLSWTSFDLIADGESMSGPQVATLIQVLAAVPDPASGGVYATAWWRCW